MVPQGKDIRVCQCVKCEGGPALSDVAEVTLLSAAKVRGRRARVRAEMSQGLLHIRRLPLTPPLRDVVVQQIGDQRLAETYSISSE